MNVLPTQEEVRRIASTGKYKVIPVSCEILSDFTTPIETLRRLKVLAFLIFRRLPEVLRDIFPTIILDIAKRRQKGKWKIQKNFRM